MTTRISIAGWAALPPISTTASAQTLVGTHGTVIGPFVDDQYGMCICAAQAR
ncbi:MAG: hypothetical protein IPM84_19995 [Anaerolineae bacterium]|nr:hypothetical protein [Anaerolineae bacterium]